MKRLVDFSVTLLGMLAITPLLITLGILVRTQLGSPVLFRQPRPGQHGKPFMMYKFRTMTDARDADGNLLPDAERITRFGRLLRSSSLDELPELWNVLKGDMSLVGPRPLLMQYMGCYTPEQARRHEVRPGVTGWAQVNGRNNVMFSERLKMDVWYVDNRSLLLDFKIIFLTFFCVLRHEGVRSDLDACLTEVDDCGFHSIYLTKNRNGKQ